MTFRGVPPNLSTQLGLEIVRHRANETTFSGGTPNLSTQVNRKIGRAGTETDFPLYPLFPAFLFPLSRINSIGGAHEIHETHEINTFRAQNIAIRSHHPVRA